MKTKRTLKRLTNRVSTFNQQILKFTHRNIEYFILPLVLLLVGSIIVESMSLKKNRPTNPEEFSKTSVMITSLKQNTGGSGVILKSTQFESTVLTNKHVCRLIEQGGLVIHDDQPIVIHHYKKYPYHDLCLVNVRRNLGVTTKISDMETKNFTKAFISGHPALLPHVLTSGNFSKHMVVQLVVGVQKCTQRDPDPSCLVFGAKPVLQSFDSQLVTGTILPGSSGSAVFNEKGEIAGIVFAGRSDGLSYAFIVPHSYIVDFLEREKVIPWRTVAPQLDDSNALDRIFDMQKECANVESCKQTQENLIWRK